MAEYINRDEVLKRRETVTTDDYSGNETINVVAMEEILEITPADVVERSMYEQLYEEANAFSKAYLKEREKYKQLKLNIDKSVEEIEQYLLEEDCNGNHEKGILFVLEILERNGVCNSGNKALGASFGIRKAIEILEKNLRDGNE